jgi:hypothetical protein
MTHRLLHVSPLGITAEREQWLDARRSPACVPQAKDKALALVLGKAELSQLKAGFKAKRAALVRQGLGGLPDFELEIKWV